MMITLLMRGGEKNMADKMQIKSLAQEIAGSPKTMQADIIRRFLTDSEYKQFMKVYSENRKSIGGYRGDRSISLSQALTQKETDALIAYVNTFDKPLSEIEAELGIDKNKFHSIVYRAAVKMVYQNKEALGI